MLPGYTLTSVHNRPDGTEKAKDRVAINTCANASGTIKQPLLLIGKAKNQRCFRNRNKEAMPIVYRSQNNGWVDRDQPEATTEDVSKFIQFREFSSKKRESSVKQTSILFFCFS